MVRATVVQICDLDWMMRMILRMVSQESIQSHQNSVLALSFVIPCEFWAFGAQVDQFNFINDLSEIIHLGNNTRGSTTFFTFIENFI